MHVFISKIVRNKWKTIGNMIHASLFLLSIQERAFNANCNIFILLSTSVEDILLPLKYDVFSFNFAKISLKRRSWERLNDSS